MEYKSEGQAAQLSGGWADFDGCNEGFRTYPHHQVDKHNCILSDLNPSYPRLWLILCKVLFYNQNIFLFLLSPNQIF